jgi:hypothetical protein
VFAALVDLEPLLNGMHTTVISNPGCGVCRETPSRSPSWFCQGRAAAAVGGRGWAAGRHRPSERAAAAWMGPAIPTLAPTHSNGTTRGIYDSFS